MARGPCLISLPKIVGEEILFVARVHLDEHPAIVLLAAGVGSDGKGVTADADRYLACPLAVGGLVLRVDQIILVLEFARPQEEAGPAGELVLAF